MPKPKSNKKVTIKNNSPKKSISTVTGWGQTITKDQARKKQRVRGIHN